MNKTYQRRWKDGPEDDWRDIDELTMRDKLRNAYIDVDSVVRAIDDGQMAQTPTAHFRAID